MTQKTLWATGVAALLSLILAIVLIAGEARSVRPEKSGPLFPGIADQLSTVTKIAITTKSGTFTLQLDGSGKWVMPERNNYPVDLDKARDLVGGFADAERVEAKTDQKALYVRIGVGDPAEDALAARVEMSNAKGNVLAALIVGKREPLPGQPGMYETFVRLPDEAQSWLVSGLSDITTHPTDWLNRDFISIDGGRVQSVSVEYPKDRQGVENVTVEKAAPGDAHYAVKGLPSSHELKSEGAADALPRALDTAQFDDVGPAAEAPKTDPVAVTFRTFDGLVLSMTVTGTKGDYWLVARASVDEAAKDAFAKGEGSAAVPAPADVDKEAQDLNKRLSGWAYKLPQYLSDDLLVTRATFVTPKTQPESKSKAK